jgi:hypothetical protein
MRPPDAHVDASHSASRPLAIVSVALPVAIIVALVLTYLLAPAFYLRHVLEAYRRETQAVEIATFVFLVLAGLVLVRAVWRQAVRWRTGREPGSGWALGILVLVMLACFFVAGEEIDWGDSWGLWGAAAPKGDLDALNIHNTSALPIKSLGSLFLVAVFFGLPIAWALRDRLKLPSGLGAAVPRWPVIVAMALAFGWRLIKNVYVGFVGEANLGAYSDGGLYWQFIEQINEQKELLIAAALFLYAVWRLRATRPPRPADATQPTPPAAKPSLGSRPAGAGGRG